MKYKDLWDELTVKMGYWLDLDSPYITFDNKYIETVWYLLKTLYDKECSTKDIPFSHILQQILGLSTHELSKPGCYRNVKDNSVVAQFKLVRNANSEYLFKNIEGNLYIWHGQQLMDSAFKHSTCNECKNKLSIS